MTVLPGGQRVLHRLTLAVEVLGALTSRPVTAPVEVRREGSRRQLLAVGGGRFLLRARPGTGDRADLRITDATRQTVPRRLRIPLWAPAELEAADEVPPGPFVPAASRLLRVWLAPGTAGAPGPGFTAVRGRVARGDVPVRWPRIAARGPGGIVVGRTHGDERGEFLLPLTGPGALPPPVPSQLTVDLLVHARDLDEPSPDPLADLPLESVPRSSSPPLPADLDNPLLRGVSPPAGYVPSTAPVPTVDVAVGDLLLLPEPLQFTP
ncbi:hypothetical protein SRB5_27480 [Streptomyces sp. RB5]|uniref:Uncharacterized protein n=1 Tax=Streptomyces smaragdinus TaxID=2585196 RepID=A0A7K0CI10_9ACTN|nr:hypothetical protein [Streptomyces smaragdinus]MQY12612.1 hypothetical protein [Streptomyces smaragdinus]